MLPAETAPGQVGLIVTDLDRSIRYYTEQIGLRELRRNGGEASMGTGDRPLIHLTEQQGARRVQQGRTGLYHFALLLPSRRDLAGALRRLIITRTPLTGMSDHGVSEAIYLSDPDGHGIELYQDRPSAEWPMRNGELSMTIDPLDVDGLLAEWNPEDGDPKLMPDGTRMGHVHLHVRSIPEAEAFYCGTVEFDLVARYGAQAAFVSAGGYHHHLGLNTWAGVGAPPPPEDAARLAWYEVMLPDAASLAALTSRLRAAGVPVTEGESFLQALDPSQNVVHFRQASL